MNVNTIIKSSYYCGTNPLRWNFILKCFFPQTSIPYVIYIDTKENNENSTSEPGADSSVENAGNDNSSEIKNNQNESSERSSRVKINIAAAEELEKLGDIVSAIAKRIVKYLIIQLASFRLLKR